MGRRYEIWRCEFEKFVRLQQRWCELLEAEAEEEREPGCSAKEDQPPALRGSVALGSLAKIVQEKVSSREEEADEGKGDVVGCPWVAPICEGKEKVVDAAAATSDKTQANVEELSSGADGVGVHGEGLALGNRPHDETRPRTQDGRAESARLACGQHEDMAWRTKPHAGWFSTRVGAQMVVRGLQVDVGAASPKVARCGRWFGRIVHRWMATTEQVRMQRQVTTVGMVAKFWEIARKQRVTREKQEEDQVGRWGGPARDLLPNTSVPFS